MASRRFLILSVLVAIGGGACSSGWSQGPPAQQSSRAVPMGRSTYQPPPPANGHYLYAADGSAVDLYSLPLTPNSRVVYSIVDINPNNSVYALFADKKYILFGDHTYIYVYDPTNGFRVKCYIGTYPVDGIAEDSNSLIVAAETPTKYLTEYGDGTAQDPCLAQLAFPPPFFDKNGMTGTDDITADDSYVYLSNFFVSGSSILVYPVPFTASTAPIIAVNSGAARNEQIVATKTDLYLAQRANGAAPGDVLDYSLPLSSSSLPVAKIAPPSCDPYGVAVYPPDDDLGTKKHGLVRTGKIKTSEPQELFVSCSSAYFYTYELPLSSSSTPLMNLRGVGRRLSAR